MTAPPDVTDHEAVFRMVYERRWTDLLAFVYRHRGAIAGDPLLGQAVATFASTFLAELAQAEPAGYMHELETLFLLHTGGFYALPPAQFEQVVAALVTGHAAHPEAARGYARFCPDHPACAAVLRHAPVPPAPVAHTQHEVLEVRATDPDDGVDHTLSLFKSQQEVDFFMAVREVYATYFVYPNVALSCLVDYDRIRDRLSASERHYFFRALVDCVVFDQHDAYRPRYFFELDSALHDTDVQQARDRSKERILALAGQKLHRIRKRGRGTRAMFVRLLREIASQEER